MAYKKLKYRELIKFIENLSMPKKWDLKRIRKLCKLSNVNTINPTFKIIHITGTNGKGSCASAMSSILNESGYNVGLYTSPHLVKINERIKINEKNISNKEFEKYGNEIINAMAFMKNKPSFFETITCIALKYFQDKKIDFLIAEVGMGGRLDATNILNGIVSVITNVDFDHMQYLGKSINSIVKEKCGIIKRNGYTVTCSKNKIARKFIKKYTSKMNSKLFMIDKNFFISKTSLSLNGTNFYLKFNNQNKRYFTNMIGLHQSYNIGASIIISKILNENSLAKISEKNIINGIRKIKWPARFEIISEKTLIILDGAHNINGVEYLVKTLKKLKLKNITFVIAIFRDKEYDKMIKLIANSGLAKNMIFTKSDSPRATEPEELIVHVPKKFNGRKELYQSFYRALERAEELPNKIVVCGSLYNAKYVYEYFKRKK